MSRYQEALHRRREPRLGALAPRRCSRPLRPLLSRLYTAEGPSQYLKPSTDEPAVAQQAPAGCSVAPPPLRPASEAYGGVRPARAEQPPGNTLATPNRRPSTCSQPRMGSPPSSHHRHITCAQSNALFPIGFATRKTISISMVFTVLYQGGFGLMPEEQTRPGAISAWRPICSCFP